mgnify:FL=1
MTTMASALKSIGGGQVVGVIPANAIALAGLGETSPGSGKGDGGSTSGTPNDQASAERLVSLG